jgi:hypothetical protein
MCGIAFDALATSGRPRPKHATPRSARELRTIRWRIEVETDRPPCRRKRSTWRAQADDDRQAASAVARHLPSGQRRSRRTRRVGPSAAGSRCGARLASFKARGSEDCRRFGSRSRVVDTAQRSCGRCSGRPRPDPSSCGAVPQLARRGALCELRETPTSRHARLRAQDFDL